MEGTIISAQIPGHGLFRITGASLTDLLLKPISTASLFHIQREVATNVGVRIAEDGSHDYSDLGRAEALIVLAYVTGGSAD